jgi:pimeloyl-ACP methyl ester carboxylesterase
VVLVSGASPDEAAVSPGVPVLAIQGVHDSQISASVVRAYADRVGARYVSLDAGHFAMLVREREAMGAVTEFLRHRGGHGITPARTAAASSHPPSREAPL